MAKSFKFKDNMYLDTKSIVHDKKLLSDVLNKLSKNPVGEFTIWQGNKLITNDNTFQYLGTYYNLYPCLQTKFPEKIGFTRKYKLALDWTDSKTSGNIYIRFTDINGNNIQEKMFPYTYGSINDGIRKTYIQDAPDLSVYGNGHVNLSCTPDWASGGQFRIYRVYLLVYDELEV